MSKHKEHINLFDELIRVINLKSNIQKTEIHDVNPEFENIFKPSSDIYEKTLNELVACQTKINKRRAKHRLFYMLIVAVALILSGLFCFKNHRINNGQIPSTKNPSPMGISLSKDSVEIEQDSVATKKEYLFIEKSNTPGLIKKTQTNSLITAVVDTTINQSQIADSIFTEKEPINRINTPILEQLNTTKSYCKLPKTYRILFKEDSDKLDEKFKPIISEIAKNIMECENLKKVEITGYYTQRFLVFTNKKQVENRIYNLKKQIKKHKTPSRILRKAKVNLLKAPKENSIESGQVIEVRLSD